jgi:hypothetical protein
MSKKHKWFKDPLPCPFCGSKVELIQTMGGSYGPKWTHGTMLMYGAKCIKGCVFPDHFELLGSGCIRSAKNDWNNEVQEITYKSELGSVI